MRYPSAAFGGGRRAPSDSLAPPPPPARGRAPREPRGARMLVPFPEVGMAFRATEASCSAGDVFLASLASNHVHPPSRDARVLEGPRPHHSPARQQHRRRVGPAPILRTVPFRQASHPMNLLPPARRAASLGASSCIGPLDGESTSRSCQAGALRDQDRLKPPERRRRGCHPGAAATRLDRRETLGPPTAPYRRPRCSTMGPSASTGT
jgi:hypothetical protein